MNKKEKKKKKLHLLDLTQFATAVTLVKYVL